VRAREIGTVALRECYHLHPERNDPAMSGRSGIKGSESLKRAAGSKPSSRILTLAPLETAERRNADRTGSDGDGRIAPCGRRDLCPASAKISRSWLERAVLRSERLDPERSRSGLFRKIAVDIRVPSLNRHPRQGTRTSYAPLPTSNRRPILAADHQLLG